MRNARVLKLTKVWKETTLGTEEEAKKCSEILKTYGFEALNRYLDEQGYAEETLFDTESYVSIHENGYKPTVEIMMGNEKIAENGTI